MPATLARTIWQASTVLAAPTPLPTWAVAGTIWGLVGVLVLALASLAFLESLTYFLRQPPITWYVRTALSTHVVLGLVIGLAAYALAVAGITHFFIDR
jgi:uncharacterized membrane protein